jgi:hypothetical protein
MIDPANGLSVSDRSVTFRLSDLRKQVRATLASGGQK